MVSTVINTRAIAVLDTLPGIVACWGRSRGIAAAEGSNYLGILSKYSTSIFII